jgi:hypothetical protein
MRKRQRTTESLLKEQARLRADLQWIEDDTVEYDERWWRIDDIKKELERREKEDKNV